MQKFILCLHDIGEDFQYYKYKRSVVVPIDTTTVTTCCKVKQNITQPLETFTSFI